MRPEQVEWVLYKQDSTAWGSNRVEHKTERFTFKSLVFYKVTYVRNSSAGKVSVIGSVGSDEDTVPIPLVRFNSPDADYLANAYTAEICNLADCLTRNERESCFRAKEES